MGQPQVSDSSDSLKQHLHACLQDLTCRVQKIRELTADDNDSMRTDESAHGLAVSCASLAHDVASVTLDPPARPCNTSSLQGEGRVNEHGVCVTPWDDELRMLRSGYATSGEVEAPARAEDTSIAHDTLASIEQDASVQQHLEQAASMQHALLSSVQREEEAETALVLSPQHSFTSPWLLPTPLLPTSLPLTEEGRTESQGAAGWSETEVIEEAGEEEEEECLGRAKRLLAFLKGASADA